MIRLRPNIHWPGCSECHYHIPKEKYCKRPKSKPPCIAGHVYKKEKR